MTQIEATEAVRDLLASRPGLEVRQILLALECRVTRSQISASLRRLHAVPKILGAWQFNPAIVESMSVKQRRESADIIRSFPGGSFKVFSLPEGGAK